MSNSQRRIADPLGGDHSGDKTHQRWLALVSAQIGVAAVDTDRSFIDTLLTEFTVSVLWFFAGHRNKLTADASLISAETVGMERWRVRVQWDVSI